MSEQDMHAQELLNTLNELPVAEHAEVFEEIHSTLQQSLAEIDGL